MCSTNVHPRIIPVESADPDEAPARPPVRHGGFNYATLLRQARLRSERTLLRKLRDTDAHSVSDAGRDDAVLPTLPNETVPVDEDTGDDVAEQESIRARERRQEEHTTPFVAELAKQQARIAGLMQFLATRVVDFCSDDAIVEHGNWTIRIKLDPALLPECTLELGLSHFDLTLRFETEHEPTRKLICRHEDVLKEQLVTLLQQMDTPREVSIDVS
ncbi:type III secretion system protein SctP [Paraburkholderia sediminicola]|uniref:type III secretion system protein SctP n=1 Tax=Paraburkholderia sediminicola TaxID=458836 RepID=UPI0038BDA753